MSGRIVAVYADGGVIGSNPSNVGVVFAWCHVDALGARVRTGSGLIEANGAPLGNNFAELVAAVSGLEALPEGWSGQLCSDSQVTLGRLCWGWRLDWLPGGWAERGSAALRRLGPVEPVQLDGHPTRLQLLHGRGKRGNPVSHHNVWCDEECNRVKAAFGRGERVAV